jgi:hypothetical protein
MSSGSGGGSNNTGGGAAGGRVPIQAPDAPVPERFADAYAELQAIAEELKPAAGRVPDVDRIEPLVRRANALARFCEGRIAAVKGLLNEGEDRADGHLPAP